MYQSMGDVLAQQYGGSAAHNIPSALSSFFASVGLKVDSFARKEREMREIISIHIEHAGIHVGIHAGSSTASSMEFNLMGRLLKLIRPKSGEIRDSIKELNMMQQHIHCRFFRFWEFVCRLQNPLFSSNGETTGFPVTPHNEQLSYASTSKKRLDTISDSAKESKQSVFIMDTHTFEMYTSSLNKRTSSSPKKLSRCSIHLPQSNFDKEDPVNNGIGDDPKS
ncbi:hypothetical protein ACFX13_032744 [Malus domestica]